MKKVRDLFSTSSFVHLILVRPLVQLVFGVSVTGAEHISEHDQYIVIANHNSHLDIFLLFHILRPDRIAKTHPIAAADYFRKNKLLFHFVDFLFKPVWVNRDTGKTASIREAQRKLDEGHSLIIFPEGTRGETSEIQKFLKGIGLLAKNNPHVPIIPVYLEGPERAFPKKAYFPLPLVNYITISPPQVLKGKAAEITMTLYDHTIRVLEEKKALRQRRSKVIRSPFVIAVIGIDGSGKSTLSRRLVHFFQDECFFIGDDLEFFMNGEACDTQPLMANEFRKWVGKQAKKAKNLALYKIPKLTELLLRDRLLLEVERWYHPRYIFLDGAPLLNMVGWAILYREEFFNQEACAKAIDILTGKVQPTRKEAIFKQYPELFALSEFRLNHLTLPDVTIFLDVAPEVCVQRIESRGEAIQPHENIPKLSKLRDAYKLVCQVLEKKHAVYVVPGDRSLDQIARESADFIKEVTGRRNGTN